MSKPNSRKPAAQQEKYEHIPNKEEEKDPSFKKRKKFGKPFPGKETKGRNDPAWYFKYPELAKLSARIAFNRRNGAILPAQYGSSALNRNIDPILTAWYMLTPGISRSADSAINVTSYAAWKMLNRRFRGVSKYQQADFGIIQFAILDFMASLAEAERIYGILNFYSLNNKQLPNKLLISLGVDPFSFTDLADYRLRLNRLILNAKTLCLVKGYGLLDHALLLASNVFKDKDNPRSQVFAFVKAGHWIYDPTLSTGSAAKFLRYATDTRLTYDFRGTPQYTHLRTQDTILNDLSYQLSALLTDDDVDNVCSDILAFYGNKEDAAEVVTLSLLPEDYVVEPVYSDSICRQFHNMVNICGHFQNSDPATVGTVLPSGYSTKIPTTIASDGGVYVYQENNVIKFNIHHYAGTPYLWGFGGLSFRTGTTSEAGRAIIRPIIDTDILNPSEEDIMEMTRLTLTTEAEWAEAAGGVTYYHMPINALSSVLIMNVSGFSWSDDVVNYAASSGVGYTHTITQNGLEGELIASTFTGMAENLEAMITKFDWSPIRVVSTGVSHYVLGDVDNCIAIDNNTLLQMHEIALISEFKNPISDFLIKE